MRLLSSVVWSEGMYLAPHHFQAQNRYFENSLRTYAESLCFRPYGLAGYALEPEALRNGAVVLLHARGIMEDGLCFNAPDSDPLPAPLNIAEQFPASSDHVIIYLPIPARRNGAASPAVEFSTRDIAAFWLLHAINCALASLRHLWTSKRGHPEELFLEMSRLGGALCTFAPDSHPRTLPKYDHDDLSACFAALD